MLFFRKFAKIPKSLILQLFPRFRTFSPALSVQSVAKIRGQGETALSTWPAFFICNCLFICGYLMALSDSPRISVQLPTEPRSPPAIRGFSLLPLLRPRRPRISAIAALSAFAWRAEVRCSSPGSQARVGCRRPCRDRVSARSSFGRDLVAQLHIIFPKQPIKSTGKIRSIGASRTLHCKFFGSAAMPAVAWSRITPPPWWRAQRQHRPQGAPAPRALPTR